MPMIFLIAGFLGIGADYDAAGVAHITGTGIAVSYTHLDVYKRQSFDSSVPSMLMARATLPTLLRSSQNFWSTSVAFVYGGVQRT